MAKKITVSSDIQEIIFVVFYSAKNAKMHAENLQTINNVHWPSPKGRKFMVKEIRKTSVIKLKKKEFWGSPKLNLESLFLKIKKGPVQKESFSNILGESNQLSI